MNTNSYRVGLIAALVVLLCCCFGVDRAHAQDEKVQVLFSESADDAGNAKPDLLLRPNITQSFYVFVDNPTSSTKKLMVALRSNNPPAEIAKSALLTIPPGKRVPVQFGKPTPMPAGAPPAASPEIKGPPFSLKTVLIDNKNSEVDQRDVDVRLQVPSSYVQVSNIEYDGRKNVLMVALRTLPTFSGPACKVQLVMDRVPGLIANKRKQGTYSDSLDKGGQVFLTAEDLQFKANPPGNGLVYVTVDGYERAFIYEATFDRQGGKSQPQPLPRNQPSLRIVAPPFSVPGPKYPITVEVDNAPRSDVVVELSVDHAGNRIFTPRKFPVGDREQHVFINPQSEDGGVVFRTAVRDWRREEDLSDIRGERKIRARLLERQGNVIDVVENQDDAVYAAVFLDDSPPEEAEFVDPPASAAPGSTFEAKVQASDPESGIGEVAVFVGKPVKDAVPEDAQVIKAKPPDSRNGNGVWVARVPLPADGRSADVSVKVVNRVGLAKFGRVKIDLVAAGTGPNAITGTIKGVVSYGARRQPNLKVALTDEKGTEKATTTTNDDGEFTFEKVMPGSYRISSVNVASQTKGVAAVTVEAGKTAEVPIKLSLQ